VNLLISATVLPYRDREAALRFYRDTLGLDVREDVQPGDGRRIVLGCAQRPGISIVLEPSDVSDAVVILETSDLDGAFERVEGRGAEVVQEPSVRHDGVRRCAFLDPAGNIVRIEELPRPAAMASEPRPRDRRRRDVEWRLAGDVDLWVASASATGTPHLVPLSFDWDGVAILMATPADTPTGRNLLATRTARLALGHARDVVMIDGEAEAFDLASLPIGRVKRFVAHTGFDPRTSPGDYRWFQVSPRRIQAWRTLAEMPERELMRNGRWVTGSL
jgi:predicted enzyme related to lactoylglutathione lyase